jgi:hypothetical protein
MEQSMNDTSNTAAELDQADEEILTSTLSDEALEAAAGEGGGIVYTDYTKFMALGCCYF